MHGPRLFEYDGASLNSFYTEIYPLPSNYVEEITFDCQGNTWFGGTDILTRFDGISWTDFTIDDMGIPADYFSISSISLDTATCDLWIAFYENNGDPIGFTKFDGNAFTNYTTQNGRDVHKVLVAPNGTIWVASSGDGLGRLSGNTWTWFKANNSPLEDYVFDIALDQQGRIWATTYTKGVFVYNGIAWTNFNASNSPIQNDVHRFLVDNDGNVWMSTNSGAVRFDGVNWIGFPGPVPLNATPMAQEANGAFWFSGGYGIYKNNGNDFTLYDLLNAPLGKNGASKIKIDPYGNKWFLHGVGVTVFNENGISNQLINPPYSVQGSVFFDTNKNGNHEPVSEPGLPGQSVRLLPEDLVTYSGYGGYYKLHPTPGNHQIEFQPASPYVPTTASPISLLMGNSDQAGFNFGGWVANPPDSIGLEVIPGLARCSQTTPVWVQVTNFGLFDVAGSVQLVFDPLLTFLSSDPAPESVLGNSITWKFEGLSPYEYDPIKVVFQSPDATFVGEWLNFTGSAILGESGQPVTDVAATELRCSLDPNDKQAAPTGASVAQFSLLGDALDYTIRFQNKGNDTAFVVVIRDTLDASLDPTSFQLLAASHPVRVTMGQGRVLTFFFEDINLLWESFNEPASHGFVKYRIAPKAGLSDNTHIHNTAHIYFDFNPAIVTNTTKNTLVEQLPFLTAGDQASRAEVKVYPNPSNGSFWVETQAGTGQWSLQVQDISGRLVYATEVRGNKAQVKGLPAGFFIVTIKQGGQTLSRKVVVGK